MLRIQFILDEILKPILFIMLWGLLWMFLCANLFMEIAWDLNVEIEQKPTKENCIQLFNSLN